MFVRVSDKRKLATLGDIGFQSTLNPIVSLSEFTYRRGTEIFGEKEPAEHVYQLKSGAVRSYKLLSDGRRQIGAFHLKGDIFGWENGETHRFTAEAIIETTVRIIRRESLQAAAESDGLVARNLLRMASTNLEHAENHMLLLGRKTALERVAAFLAEMDSRTDTTTMSLPMFRHDIADYLGLTIETVSRAISRLERAGVLSFVGTSQRELVVLDREKLKSFDLQE